MVSAGRFTVNSNGQLSTSSFSINREKLNAALTYVLTIEPAVGDDPAPSDVHVVAGNFSGSSASLSSSHPAALNVNFNSATGKYILATPTDGGSMDNEDSGVWFIDNSSGSPVMGLNLPVLPSSWKYEGWVVINGNVLSTGTFSMSNTFDMFSGYSKTQASPPFPGEDFLMNAPSGLNFPVNLRGSTVVISVESNPDNSPAPFAFKPLIHTAPNNALTHSVINMNLNLGSLATGSVSR